METILDAIFFLVILVFTLLIGSLLFLRRPSTVVYVVSSDDWVDNRSFGCLPVLVIAGILVVILVVLAG